MYTETHAVQMCVVQGPAVIEIWPRLDSTAPKLWLGELRGSHTISKTGVCVFSTCSVDALSAHLLPALDPGSLSCVRGLRGAAWSAGFWLGSGSGRQW